MKLLRFIKSWLTPMSEIEVALLKSIKENPNGWMISTVNGNLVAHNRELSIILTNDSLSKEVKCRDLVFGDQFATRWRVITYSMALDRSNAERAAGAKIAEAALRRSLNLK